MSEIAIGTACAQLDAEDDANWTADGAPRLDALEKIMGRKFTRKEVTEALPEFNRDAARVGAPYPPPSDEEGQDKEDEDDAEGQTEAEGEQGEAEAAEDGEAVADEADADEAEVSSEPEEADPATHPTTPYPGPYGDADQPTMADQPAMADEPVAVDEDLPPRPYDDQLSALENERDKVEKALAKARDEFKAAKAEFDRLNGIVDRMNQQIAALESHDPNRGIRGIRAYIDRQNQTRAEKAQRQDVFLNGLKPGEASELIGTGSKLDRALAARRAPRGSGRPEYPTTSRR